MQTGRGIQSAGIKCAPCNKLSTRNPTLHLDSLGKSLIAKQIAIEICGLIEGKVNSLITLKWKYVPKGNLETIISASSGFDNSEGQQNYPNQ
jgi:hypothetical protein